LLFDQPNPAAANGSQVSWLKLRVRRLLSFVAIFALMSAATAAMMLCPCDSVGIHDYYAISLVALAVLFGIAAAYLAYRRMQRDSGITRFLRVVIALAAIGFGVYVELFVVMEIVAWLARAR
jgi:uncharacterized membrane protein YadS